MLKTILNHIRERQQKTLRQKAYSQLATAIFMADTRPAFSLNRLWRATDETPYYGQFADRDGRLVDGYPHGKEKRTLERGYALEWGTGSRWVGATPVTVHKSLQNLGMHVPVADLWRLHQGKVDELLFPEPNVPSFSSYVLDDEMALLAGAAGYRRYGSFWLEQDLRETMPQPGDILVVRNTALLVYTPDIFHRCYAWDDTMAMAA